MVTLKPHSATNKAVPLLRPPVLLIEPLAHQKMNTIIDNCADEVGWFGAVHEVSAGTYIMTDVFLPKQVVNAATCEIDPEGLVELGSEILARPDGVEVYNSLRLWGHSHVNMGVSPSGQDEKQFRDLVAESTQQEWYFRVIANKKGEMKVDLLDLANFMMWEDISWEINLPHYDLTELEERIKTHVQRKTYVWTGAQANGNFTKAGATCHGTQTTVVSKKDTEPAAQKNAKKNAKKYSKQLAKAIRKYATEIKYSRVLGATVYRMEGATKCPTCGKHTYVAIECQLCGKLCCPDDYDMETGFCTNCVPVGDKVIVTATPTDIRDMSDEEIMALIAQMEEEEEEDAEEAQGGK